MSELNLGDAFDHIATVIDSDRTAIISGETRLSYGDLERQSNSLGRSLLELGLEPGDKVGIFAQNCAEYLVTTIAVFKARLVHVNINYRYQQEELAYLIDYCDISALIYHPDFSETLFSSAEVLSGVPHLVEMDTAGQQSSRAQCHSYNKLCNGTDGTPLNISRSPDDLFFMCTGGTTGMPKAVMWRQADYLTLVSSRMPSGDTLGSFEELAPIISRNRMGKRLIAPPLMHGTALNSAMNVLLYGGCVVLLTSRGFDSLAALKVMSEEAVSGAVIVGDPFAKPLLNELRSQTGAYDLSSLRVIFSSGAPWTIETKEGLLEFLSDDAILIDAFGSSESAAYGQSVVGKKIPSGGGKKAGAIRLNDATKVFTEDFEEVQPGDDQPGFVAIAGVCPVGYYKDPEKSAETFIEVKGVRYTAAGDWATVNEDGTLNFLGRGNTCINTGGEKVYPQEVEEVIASLPAVFDNVVVGTPDDRFGEAVTAIIQLVSGSQLSFEELKSHTRSHLADYKSPKRMVLLPSLERAANGKADYRRLQTLATELLSGHAPG